MKTYRNKPIKIRIDFLSTEISHTSGDFTLMVLQSMRHSSLSCTLGPLTVPFLSTGRDLPF